MENNGTTQKMKNGKKKQDDKENERVKTKN